MQLKDTICIDLMFFIQKTPNDVVIPNYYFGAYEFDLFRLTYGTNYVFEYEIKTSRADFKNDFKKKRIVKFSNEPDDFTEVFKHEEISKKSYCSNKFFFVVPKDLIKVDEVPDPCGLIYYDVDKPEKFEIVKAAKFINKKNHCENLSPLVKSLSNREYYLRIENLRLKKQLKTKN